jgi:hypothetical protein
MKDAQHAAGNEYQKFTGALSRRDMLTLMALTGGSLILGCAINPVTGQKELSFMSPEQELAIDKQYAPDQCQLHKRVCVSRRHDRRYPGHIAQARQ